ncbi:MAG: L-rhamnose isomerase [Treponema sp.]|jgi:L-rhamnose isomerase|nr:L-rhamnose isomerase [Treponema sp.]
MKNKDIYADAKEQYAALGVDTDAAISRLKQIPVSLHCWQGDDVGGFETSGAVLDGGGIQVTGNYPGRSRTIAELRHDIEKVMTLIPGTYRLNLHASYADFSNCKPVDRDKIEPKHFESWINWALEQKLPLDFNATLFSHPKAAEMTLASKDRGIRDFWIEHTKRCRDIGAYFGEKQGSPCIHNIWIPDGMKDIPSDRQGYREILLASLDDILSKPISSSYLKDSVESKVFGIGSESYVVGSHEFYMGYAVSRKKMLTIDMGHFHPTENVSDKLSSILLFVPELLLHLSRCVRWDSDHVIIFNDDQRAMAEEIIRTGKLDRIHIGTDFFDGSINRIGAWVIGARATEKALLYALLEPHDRLVKYEEAGNYFARLALNEELKTMPFGTVWQRYCEQSSVPSDTEVISAVMEYEKDVTSKR